MKTRLAALLLTMATTASALYAEDARWLTGASISPDGSTIAFSYKGELFTVPTTGGTATRLTSDASYDGNPVWSPDGKNIAFLSTREGSDDIFIISSKGGTPRRLTTSSRNETPLTFLNDSILLYSTFDLPSRESIRAPFISMVKSINVNKTSPRPKTFLSMPVSAASANSRGEILLQDRKGVEDVLRKHEHSSGTADIVLYSGGKFQKLTTYNGQDQSPAWGAGNVYYYISDSDGTMNVFQSEIGKASSTQLTHFEKNPVRHLTASDNGLLAFCQDGYIYTLKPGQEPSKLNIEVNDDFYDGDLVKRYITSGATNGEVNADGSEIALVVRGEIYVTDSKYKTTKRITDTPWQERTVSFSSDGKSLVFDSDVNGNWQLFIAKVTNPDEEGFAYATDIEITPLYSCATSAMQPAFSPDGKKVAFLEDRSELKVIDVETKEVKTALDGKYNYSYSDGDIPFAWSPDSKWLLITYLGNGGWNNLDIAAVKADGSEVVDLTESGYNQSNPKWALGGKGVTFETEYYGMKAHGSWGNQTDVMLMLLDPSAWEEYNYSKEEAELAKKAKDKAKDEQKDSKDNKKKKDKKKDKESGEEEQDIKLNFTDRRHRTVRLTQNSSSIYDYFLSPEGDKLYYISQSPEGDGDLLMVDLKEKETKTLRKGISGMFAPDKKGENVFLFSYNGISNINLDNGELTPVEYEAFYDRKPSMERAYIFDHAAKQVEDKFYDKNLHGVDWKYYTDHYREFLPYINNNRDFSIMLSELLGELNASHTGSGYRPGSTRLQTAFLGAYFDEEYDGEGIKVTEVFPGSPLSLPSVNIVPGEIITSIDGETILPETDYYPLLDGKAGKKTRLGVKKANGEETYVTVKPLAPGMLNEMAYKRWVARNEQYVDSISNGRIGYVHVRGMDGSSYNEVYDRLLGKYRNCDAVVVDTRHNGGGWLHNDIAILLSGHKYVTFAPRGREIGAEPFSQWYKPSVMLVNESNYSDAHGTPYTYQTLGIGDVVGAPIPGTMTAVWWEYQVDPTIFFGIPQVTNMANDGTVLENTQLNPDVIIYNDPADIENGKDEQLEGAVFHLLNNKLNK